MSRNIFYVYKLKKYRSVPTAPADGQKIEDQLIGLIPLNRHLDLAVEGYQANEPQAEMPRARGWIPGTGMVLDPLDISLMFDWV